MTVALPRSAAWSTRYLLFIAGMGGLLYGIDVGIIAGALPYLESTAALAWKLNAQQLSFIVAAVLLGSVLSSLFAGLLADVVGVSRRMPGRAPARARRRPVPAAADGGPRGRRVDRSRAGTPTIFFFGAACTVVYFLASAFLLPETRGKTLEEIEGFFARPAAK